MNRINRNVATRCCRHGGVGGLRRRSHRRASVVLEIGGVEADGFADEHHRLSPSGDLDQEFSEIAEAFHAIPGTEHR